MKKDIWLSPGAFLPKLKKMVSLISSIKISGHSHSFSMWLDQSGGSEAGGGWNNDVKNVSHFWLNVIASFLPLFRSE